MLLFVVRYQASVVCSDNAGPSYSVECHYRCALRVGKVSFYRLRGHYGPPLEVWGKPFIFAFSAKCHRAVIEK